MFRAPLSEFPLIGGAPLALKLVNPAFGVDD